MVIRSVKKFANSGMRNDQKGYEVIGIMTYQILLSNTEIASETSVRNDSRILNDITSYPLLLKNRNRRILKSSLFLKWIHSEKPFHKTPDHCLESRLR